MSAGTQPRLANNATAMIAERRNGVQAPSSPQNGDDEPRTAALRAEFFIASEGRYDDVYFYFYPYGLLY